MEFLTLKFDVVFKEVFSNEKVRRHFISDVTDIPLEEIKSVRLATPFLFRPSVTVQPRHSQNRPHGLSAAAQLIFAHESALRS